jgi:hypothetical protein
MPDRDYAGEALARAAAKTILEQQARREARDESARLNSATRQSPSPRSDPRKQEPPPSGLSWHGSADPHAGRPWMIKGLIPEVGHGLLSGQWGMGKTFGVFDLAGALMTGGTFAGRHVTRKAGVLLIAAEGQSEIRKRLKALLVNKLELDADHLLPICWVEECPPLLSRGALEWLKAKAAIAEAKLQTDFGLPLGLVGIDTIGSAAGFKDENDSAECQRAMNVLAGLARAAKVFVLGVDHYGKTIEAGTRGGSSKETSADVVLVFVGERSGAGKVSDTRMLVRKVRGGKQGYEVPFTLPEVELGRDQDGDPITTCVVDWGAVAGATDRADRWPKSRRVFREALRTALIEHGQDVRPFGDEGSQVKAVDRERVRDEFYKAYSADGTDEQKQDAKRQAFRRQTEGLQNLGLIGVREVGGKTLLWVVEPKSQRDSQRDSPEMGETKQNDEKC